MSESDEQHPDPVAESLSPAQEQQLSDEQLQEQYRQAYLEQLRRRSCPGCGDTDLF